MMAEQEEALENASFLDGLISQETRRRTREQTRPLIDACCSPGCIRSTVLTFGIASLLLTALLITIFLAHSNSSATPTLNPNDPPYWMLSQVTEDQLRDHMAFLSSDLLEGRAPGTRGERLTTGYIASHFRAAGLSPLNHSTFEHNVPMRGLTVQQAQLSLDTKSFSFGTDFTADSDLSNSSLKDLPMIFGGHCIYSPNFHLNPFDSIDVMGAIVVCLMGPIDFISNEEFSSVSEYYTSVSYKHSYLRSLRAIGVVMVHTDESMGYSWDVFQNRFGSGEQVSLQNTTDKELAYKGWIHASVASSLAQMNGNGTLASWFNEANDVNFQARKLSTKFKLDVEYAERDFDAQIVIGYLGPSPLSYGFAGSVLVMAHHDHLGMRPVANSLFSQNNDSIGIFNGAVDNASGVSALLATANAISALYKEPFIINPGYEPPALKQTVIFMTTTGRENMQGTTYFTNSWLCDTPLCGAKVVFSYDVMNVWGKTFDAVVVGKNMSTLLNEVAEKSIAAEKMKSIDKVEGVAKSLGDAWPFVLNDCPAVTFQTASDLDPNPVLNYMATAQYTPSDQYNATMDMAGLLQQVHIGLRMIFSFATSYDTPVLTQSYESLLQEIKNVITL